MKKSLPRKLTIEFLLWGMLFCSMAGWSQPLPGFPPPGFPNPFGGGGTTNQANTQVLDVGMERKPAGQAPYGTDAGGNPIWPLSDPSAPSESPVSGSEPGPTSFTSPSNGGSDAIDDHSEKVHEKTPKGSVTREAIRPLIDASFQAIPGNQFGLPAQKWTTLEVAKMKYAFLYDLQRHARFVYEGNNNLALAIALKWQILGRLHSDQIKQISMDIAGKKNFSSFELWISSIVQEDWQSVQNP